ncbi:TPA: LysR family transcriptional regulator, partial [Pseudomonas aeruginosa]|nr:LysR family transcriptional regulator [Pseudomonas aeruginosa]
RSVDPLQEGVDIVIMVGQPEDSTLVARRLLATGRWLCASPGYLAEHGTPGSVAELAGHRAVLLSTDSQRYWPLSGDSLPCQRVLSCNNITFAREAVVAGAGIAALPALICEESVRNGRLVRLLPDVPLPVGELYAVYPSRRFQAMKVKAFLDFLISRLPADSGRLLEPEAARLITSRP